MAKGDVAVIRCADCGRLLATYTNVTVDPRRLARLGSHALDLLEWHRSETCSAKSPIVSALPARRSAT